MLNTFYHLNYRAGTSFKKIAEDIPDYTDDGSQGQFCGVDSVDEFVYLN